MVTKKRHEDYITHINNDEDLVYLKNTHFPVNMRLFHTSKGYRDIILQQCDYIRELCLDVKEGYKKPHGMSSANAGLAFNIIGITRNRNLPTEYCEIMINPRILRPVGEEILSLSNCGSLTLETPISVKRWESVEVGYYTEGGHYVEAVFTRTNSSLTIQHEIDHNLGILILDRKQT